MKPIIRVENLSKQYRLGTQQASYATLRDSLTNAVAAPFRRFKNPNSAIRHPPSDMIWALKDINFEVMSGEVVGIIGRNGAGKSTLLKILSRITEPTTGKIDLYGRVSSLLEVGTGFHPELTGRENIYLNGAVLGMKRAEITRKFDEIVAFAEIEKFLDTPVKHYSSGMYMRLAFSVAAHLEPEILIVDEVLAVGDIAFQQKCLSKMGDVAKEGRTVLFVSHNLQAVGSLCTRAVLLDGGVVIRDDSPPEVIRRFLNQQKEQFLTNRSATSAHFKVERINCQNGKNLSQIQSLQPLVITVDVRPLVETRDIAVHVLIQDEEGKYLVGVDSVDFGAVAEYPGCQTAQFELTFPHCPLPPGEYIVDLYVNSYSNHIFDFLPAVTGFSVSQEPVYGSRLFEKRWHGEIATIATFQVST